MLSTEDNQRLTHIEGDAPMGRLIRQKHWIPALRSAAVEADGAPVGVRLFGKDYAVFRATDGRVGFIDEKCPHRGVSMLLARNEGCALQCIFHGIKIHVTGKAIQAPTQFGNQDAYLNRLKVNHYPAQDAGGLIWVWLGEGQTPPPFTQLEFMDIDPSAIHILIQDVACNWMQGVEATIDSSHVGVLHQNWLPALGGQSKFNIQNTAPTYEVELMDYGFRAAAIRQVQEQLYYVRTTQFLFPFYGFIPPYDKDSGDRLTIMSIPIDDHHSRQIYLRYNHHRPIREGDWSRAENPDAFAPVTGSRDNVWGQDRQAMKSGNFSGFHNLQMEDFVVMLSMGSIADRSSEQLCASDTVIVQARRMFLKALRDQEQGLPSPASENSADLKKVRSYSLLVDAPSKWNDAALVSSAT